MRKIKYLLLLIIEILIVRSSIFAQYRIDTLGGDFLQKSIEMPDDYEGKVNITLIRKTSGVGSWDAVLYIHGFNDYFFQTETADFFTEEGFNFYAVDLRKYGRSWQKHQKRGNVRKLSEYFADIDSAIYHIKSEGNRSLLLLGHSTGGLIASLYLDQLDRQQSPDTAFIKGMILNSPFLDMNMTWIKEKIGVPIIAATGIITPNWRIPLKDEGMYGKSLHQKYKGEWDYDLKWKPLNLPITAGWVKAIYAGHRKIKKGLHISQPILVLHATQSVYHTKWNDEMKTGDAVLDVNDINKYASKLGNNVEIAAIQDGIHDLALSQTKARGYYYKEIDQWIKKNIKIPSLFEY